jgi:predicted O-methyltransferase YrrM
MIPFDLDIIRRTKGFLAEEEGECLYRAALEAARIGPCLEVGSYCGKSTIYLGAACRERGQVLYAVDHHRGSEEQQPGEEYFDPELYDPASGGIDTFRFFRRTICDAGLEDTVVPLVCRSAVAARSWSAPLGLVFIDGGHGFETVQSDYSLWSPHLPAGGLLAFHDIYPDPARGGQAPYRVYRQALKSGRFAARPLVGSLGVLEHVAGRKPPSPVLQP